jgi:tetratricopeptide (TPR) repeat protein
MTILFEAALQHENAGEYEKALEYLKQCQSEQSHDRGDLAFHIGWCLENDRDGDRAEVLRYYERAYSEASSPAVRVNGSFRAGLVLMQNGEYKKAAEAFKKAEDLAEQSHLDHDLCHHVLFWHAVCLEHLGQYLEAARCHGLVQRRSSVLAPESRYREIICHNQVGHFEEALRVCREFPKQGPASFDPQRYAELRNLAKKEAALLVRCLGRTHLGKEGTSDA